MFSELKKTGNGTIQLFLKTSSFQCLCQVIRILFWLCCKDLTYPIEEEYLLRPCDECNIPNVYTSFNILVQEVLQ